MIRLWGLWRNAFRLAVGVVAATALLLIAAGAPLAQPTPIALSAVVQWNAPDGTERHLAFVGSLTGAAFTGTADDPQMPMSVSGYVSADGHLSGTVKNSAGVQTGTFTSAIPQVNVDGTKTYTGSYTLDGNHDGGTWSVTR